MPIQKISSPLSQATGWRMIVATAFAAILCWLIVLVMLRGVVAQNADPVVTETNEEEVISRRILPQTEREAESPEFRDSADNNVSFPVDI
jgi:uncharacterized membrane protein YdfJ with MMPL/SSD domain